MMCEKYFDSLNRLGVAQECEGQTDGRTDGRQRANVVRPR